MSDDGRYFGGGAWPRDGVVGRRHQDRRDVGSPSPARIRARRAADFDREGNYWSGGRGGPLVEFDTTQARDPRIRSPIPYGTMYTAAADKNDKVWAGDLQTGRYHAVRPQDRDNSPNIMLPEPYAP